MASPNAPNMPIPSSVAVSSPAARPDVRYVPVVPLDERVPPSDWAGFGRALARRKWLVLLVTLLGTGAGVVVARRLDSTYRAKAVLWIESVTPARDQTPMPARGVVVAEGWIQLATSNAVLDPVVRQLGLFVRPEGGTPRAVFARVSVAGTVRPGSYRLQVRRDRDGTSYVLTAVEGDAGGAVLERGPVRDTIGAAIGLAWLPPWEALPAAGAAFTVVTQFDAARDLGTSLKTRLDPSGEFLSLELAGSDAARAAATVNAVAERIVAVAADLKRQKFEELARILGEQYRHAAGALAQAEGALRDFQVRSARLAPPTLIASRTDGRAGTLAEPQLELEQLRRDRAALERALAAGAKVEALAVIGAAQRSPDLSAALAEASRRDAELRVLRYRYTPESEPVRRLGAELEALQQTTIPTLARALAQELAAREAAVVPAVEAAVGELRRLPPVALAGARLEREVAAAEELFASIRQQYEGARLALVSTLPDVRILDAAPVSHSPTTSLGPLVILLAVAASFGVSSAGAVILNRLDSRVRDPDQVTRGMRLTILGAVPHAGGRGRQRAVTDGQVIEALRGLRLRVLHALGVHSQFALTITSPGVGEGKSFVAANLALAFAEAGYRTLLIDGDIRRGTQHTLLHAPRIPGLTDVLAGRAQLDQAIRSTDFTGLSLLPSGTRMPRGPEFLLSRAMSELVARTRAMYDIVIVDSPPLAAGADPVVLATMTRSLLLVLRADASDASLASAHLEALESLPVRTIGAVLNDVRTGPAYRYYTYYLSDADPPAGEPALDQGPTVVGGAERS